MNHGGAPSGWLEFSANLNPLGVPAPVRAAIARTTYDRYADLDGRAAEAHLAADAGVPSECVLLTAGATEAIRLVISALGPLTDGLVIVGPAYGEYARVATEREHRFVELSAIGPTFAPPAEAARAAILGRDALLMVCDPNNPTGQTLGPGGVEALVRGAGGHTVIDQSFAPFARWQPEASDLLAAGSVVLIRSLTKRNAIPGVRVGYVIAGPETIRTLRAGQDPWSVSAHGVAAAAATSWTLSSGERDTIVAWRERLAAAVAGCGLVALSSEANFLLVHAGGRAASLVRALAARSIAVRGCASFGLPEHIRLAVRPPAEQDALCAALAEVG